MALSVNAVVWKTAAWFALGVVAGFFVLGYVLVLALDLLAGTAASLAVAALVAIRRRGRALAAGLAVGAIVYAWFLYWLFSVFLGGLADF